MKGNQVLILAELLLAFAHGLPPRMFDGPVAARCGPPSARLPCSPVGAG